MGWPCLVSKLCCIHRRCFTGGMQACENIACVGCSGTLGPHRGRGVWRIAPVDSAATAAVRIACLSKGAACCCRGLQADMLTTGVFCCVGSTLLLSSSEVLSCFDNHWCVWVFVAVCELCSIQAGAGLGCDACGLIIAAPQHVRAKCCHNRCRRKPDAAAVALYSAVGSRQESCQVFSRPQASC
jgi:hypothetical protein